MLIKLYLLKNEDGKTVAEACEFSDHTVAVRWLPVGDLSGSLQFYNDYVEWSYVAETLGKRKIHEISEIGKEVGKFPNTMDASVWAGEWIKTIKKNPSVPRDEGCMIGWFSNAIMAGYDCGRSHESEKGDLSFVIDKNPDEIDVLLKRRHILCGLFVLPSATINEILKEIGIYQGAHINFIPGVIDAPANLIERIYNNLVRGNKFELLWETMQRYKPDIKYKDNPFKVKCHADNRQTN